MSEEAGYQMIPFVPPDETLRAHLEANKHLDEVLNRVIMPPSILFPVRRKPKATFLGGAIGMDDEGMFEVEEEPGFKWV